MNSWFSYEYFADEFPIWCSYLHIAILQKNLSDETKAQEQVGKLLILSEEFLSDEQWHLLIKDTQLYYHLDEELVTLHKNAYIRSISQHSTHS